MLSAHWSRMDAYRKRGLRGKLIRIQRCQGCKAIFDLVPYDPNFWGSPKCPHCGCSDFREGRVKD